MTDKKFPPVTFEYIKSHDYKVHRVHGGIGGPNGYGELVLNLYFERGPIPKKAVHEIDNNGQLLPKAIDIDIREGVIRDVLFGIALTPENARSLAGWLLEQSKKLDRQVDEVKKHIENVKGK